VRNNPYVARARLDPRGHTPLVRSTARALKSNPAEPAPEPRGARRWGFQRERSRTGGRAPARRLAPKGEKPRKETLVQKLRGPKSRRYLLAFLAAAVIIQGLHVLEHVTQSIQVFVFGTSPAVASGLAGSIFDFPLVHFTYNFLFFGALIWGVAWVFGLGGFSKFDRAGVWAVVVAAAIQTYHAAEHVLQIFQSIETGTNRPPGFVGFFANNVIIHLLLNLIVWLPVVFAFYRFGGGAVIVRWASLVRQRIVARPTA
jgi:hypothetical protein